MDGGRDRLRNKARELTDGRREGGEEVGWREGVIDFGLPGIYLVTVTADNPTV